MAQTMSLVSDDSVYSLDNGVVEKSAPFAPRLGTDMTLETVLDSSALGGSPICLLCGPSGELWIILSTHQVVAYNSRFERIFEAGKSGMSGHEVGEVSVALFSFSMLSGLCFDSNGLVCLSDSGNHVLKRINRSSNSVSTLAGSLKGCFDGEALASRFSSPTSIVTSSLGHLVICDSGNNRIRLLADGMVYTVAGSGVKGHFDGPSLQSQFNWPTGLEVTGDGEILVADTGNHAIRYIEDELVTTVAGNPSTPGQRDGAMSEATFSFPSRFSWLPSGELLIVDMGSHTIRIMSLEARVSTLIGPYSKFTSSSSTHSTSSASTSPYASLNHKDLDAFPISLSLLDNPVSVDSMEDGRVFIADRKGIHIASWSKAPVADDVITNTTVDQAPDGTKKKEEDPSLSPPIQTIPAPYRLISRKPKEERIAINAFGPDIKTLEINAIAEDAEISETSPVTVSSSTETESGIVLENDTLINQETQFLPEAATTIDTRSQQQHDSSSTDLNPDSDTIPPPPSQFIQMDITDGYDPKMASDPSIVGPEPTVVAQLAHRIVSPPASPRLLQSATVVHSPKLSSKHLGLIQASKTFTTDSIGLSQLVLSPEAAEIIDCIHSIVDMTNHVIQEQASIDSAFVDKLKASSRTIVRSFIIIIKRYQECVQSSPTEAYLDTLIASFEPVCRSINAIGSSLIALSSPSGKSASGLNNFIEICLPMRESVSVLEFTMYSRPEGSDKASEAVTRHAALSSADSSSLSSPSPSSVFLSRQSSSSVDSPSFAAPILSQAELERSGRVSRWAPIRRSCGLFASSKRNGVVFSTTTDHLVVRFEEGGTIEVLAGLSGSGGYVNGAATMAQFRFVRLCGLAEDRFGGLIIVDSGNHCLRYLTHDYATVSTYAGDARRPGYKDGTLESARFNTPSSIVLSPHGDVILADTGNNRIRMISNGIVTTIGGSGLRGSNDGPFLEASFRSPSGLCLSPDGDLYIADYHNHLIRKLSGGFVSTIAGDGQEGYLDGEALKSRFANPTSLTMTSNGDLIVSDYYNHCLRLISSGKVSTFAGIAKMSGTKNGYGREAHFTFPMELAILTPVRVPLPRTHGHTVSNTGGGGKDDSSAIQAMPMSPPTSPRLPPASSPAAFIPPLALSEIGSSSSSSSSSTTTTTTSTSTAAPPLTTPRAILNSDARIRRATVASSTSSLASSSTAISSPPQSHMGSVSISGSSSNINAARRVEFGNPASSSSLPSSNSSTSLTAMATTTAPSLSLSSLSSSTASSAAISGDLEETRAETRLLVADSYSIRIISDFVLPMTVRQGDIGLSLVQMSWEAGHRFQPQPWILDAILSLHSTGLMIRDLWTLSSEPSHVRPIIERILNGVHVDWHTVPPRVTATVLKAFFQKLPCPLLTMELQDMFIAAAQPINDATDRRLDLLRQVVRALPIANRILLKHLMDLFSAFDDPLHIPPVWGPILLLRRSLGSFQDTVRAASRVVFTLIEHSASIFAELDLIRGTPPVWLTRINHADRVQESFGPFIRALIMTHDRLWRVKHLVDIAELFRSVELMRNVLFALQEQFLSHTVLHVIERYHLDRFQAYLTSFQDAWVKLEDSSASSSSAAAASNSSSSSFPSASNGHHAAKIRSASGTGAVISGGGDGGVLASSPPGSLTSARRPGVPISKAQAIRSQRELKRANSSYDSSSTTSTNSRVQELTNFFGGLNSATSQQPEEQQQQQPHTESPATTNSPVSHGAIPSHLRGGHRSYSSSSGIPGLMRLAENTLSISNSDSENDFDVVAHLKSDDATQMSDELIAPLVAVPVGSAPSQAHAHSAPVTMFNPLQASSPDDAAPIESEQQRVPDSDAPFTLSSEHDTQVVSPTPKRRSSELDSNELESVQSPDSPRFVVPTVKGVSPSLVVPMAAGVKASSSTTLVVTSSNAINSSIRIPLSMQKRAPSSAAAAAAVGSKHPVGSEPSSGSHSNGGGNAIEEDTYLISLLRTTKIRNQFDRLILAALYELILFSFSVDMAYRGALFANPHVISVLDTMRSKLSAHVGVPQFWNTLSNSPVVSWRTFKHAFVTQISPNASVESLVLLRKVLDNHGSGLISTTHFSHFLNSFGPIDQCLNNMTALFEEPWFKGYVTSAEAEHVLCGAEKNSFLVRFSSTHPGSFIISYSTSDEPYSPSAEFDISHAKIDVFYVDDTENRGNKVRRYAILRDDSDAHPSNPSSSSALSEKANGNPSPAATTTENDLKIKRERAYSSLRELVEDFKMKHSLRDECPANEFTEPFCFGEISEREAESTLEMEPLGTYLLRLQPRFILKYTYFDGAMMSSPPGSSSTGNRESASKNNNGSSATSPNASSSLTGTVAAPGRFWISYVKKAMYASATSSADGSSSSSASSSSLKQHIEHLKLRRTVHGAWMCEGKLYHTLKELLEANKSFLMTPYVHLPSISPIMQDDQDDRNLVLSTMLQDEEGEPTSAVDLQSGMIRPAPKTEEPVSAICGKIISNRAAPDEVAVELLMDYLSKHNSETAERLLRNRPKKGSSIFGAIRKDFVRTDAVKLESLNVPMNKLVTMTFTLTAGDKPLRWFIPDACKISSLSFFACSSHEGSLYKGEAITIKVSVVVYRFVVVSMLLRILTFTSDGQFNTCLPVFVRVVPDLQMNLLKEDMGSSSSSSVQTSSSSSSVAGSTSGAGSGAGVGGSSGNNRKRRDLVGGGDFWRIPPSDLVDTNVIESSVGATVFRANLHGATVAQKRFILRMKIDDPHMVDLKSFETELAVLRRTRHDNIASFVGAWCDPEANAVYIVMKYAEHGSLSHFLGNDDATAMRPVNARDQLRFEATPISPSSSPHAFYHPHPQQQHPQHPLRRGSPTRSGSIGSGPPSSSSSSSSALSSYHSSSSVITPSNAHPDETKTFSFKLSMALDAARAVHYLHRHNLLHRDLKSQNLLVDMRYHVQLADFGESRETNSSLMTLGRGTPKYRAPELFTRVYNNKVDIFSLGLVMAEMFGGKITTIPAFVDGDRPLLPPMPLGLPPAFLALLKACCLRNPTKRPTAKQVVQILNIIRNDIWEQEGRPRLSPRSIFTSKHSQ